MLTGRATGPVLRVGTAHDVRRAEPYGVYPELAFEIPSEATCDAMGRYLLRMAELEQCLNILGAGPGGNSRGGASDQRRAQTSLEGPGRGDLFYGGRRPGARSGCTL